MIHQQTMNFPYKDRVGFKAAESGSDILFSATDLPIATSPFPNPLSSIGYDENRVCGREMVSNSHMETMREMMFRIAAMHPVRIDPDAVKPRKRRNVRISSDPQSVAARHRRERISERIRILQRLVPGGTKMDTASMLDEAVRYLKFLRREVESLEEMSASGCPWRGSPVGIDAPLGNCVGSSSRSGWSFRGPYSIMHSHVVGEGM